MTNEQNTNMVIYNDGELELNVSGEQQTVWLNRNQIAELFGRDVKTIGKHISNVFGDGELTMQPKHGVFYDGQMYDAYAFANIDDTVFTLFYHIGASLKDLGKKWFAFSKFEMEALEILGRLK